MHVVGVLHAYLDWGVGELIEQRRGWCLECCDWYVGFGCVECDCACYYVHGYVLFGVVHHFVGACGVVVVYRVG